MSGKTRSPFTVTITDRQPPGSQSHAVWRWALPPGRAPASARYRCQTGCPQLHVTGEMMECLVPGGGTKERGGWVPTGLPGPLVPSVPLRLCLLCLPDLGLV